MKVNEKIISIPPFISTHWNNVATIHMKGTILLVTLIDGDTISIPSLTPSAVETIFHFHALHLEQVASIANATDNRKTPERGFIEQILEIPFRVGIGAIDGFSSSIMQHTSQQSEMPNLPKEFLDKVSEIVRTVGGGGCSRTHETRTPL